ncbi:hypothetical protein PSHT_11061 [Puccinia striiformis]|uniref:Uncharacterized protein n=1 Tax=Puccinia striiformis TaxID=27350 RepID=A0A2S4V5W3_9BASI|nr:hypothetical protein PSHT_11061 [Puccinia striiformis]
MGSSFDVVSPPRGILAGDSCFRPAASSGPAETCVIAGCEDGHSDGKWSLEQISIIKDGPVALLRKHTPHLKNKTRQTQQDSESTFHPKLPFPRQDHDDFPQLLSCLGRDPGHCDHLISRRPNIQLWSRLPPVDLLVAQTIAEAPTAKEIERCSTIRHRLVAHSAQNQHTSPTIDGSLRSESKHYLN